MPNKIIISRLIIATILGGIIGIEREKSNGFAGLRTHILVALGSTLIMLIPIDYYIRSGLDSNWDMGRLSSQVVSGVGFLGAGTIVHNIGKGKIDGLTTATSLWLTSGIGLAIGMGYYLPAIFSNIVILLILNSLKKIEHKVSKENRQRMNISFHEKSFDLDELLEKCDKKNVKIKRIKFNKESSTEHEPKKIEMCLELPEDLDKEEFFDCFLDCKNIK